MNLSLEQLAADPISTERSRADFSLLSEGFRRDLARTLVLAVCSVLTAACGGTTPSEDAGVDSARNQDAAIGSTVQLRGPDTAATSVGLMSCITLTRVRMSGDPIRIDPTVEELRIQISDEDVAVVGEPSDCPDGVALIGVGAGRTDAVISLVDAPELWTRVSLAVFDSDYDLILSDKTLRVGAGSPYPLPRIFFNSGPGLGMPVPRWVRFDIADTSVASIEWVESQHHYEVFGVAVGSTAIQGVYQPATTPATTLIPAVLTTVGENPNVNYINCIRFEPLSGLPSSGCYAEDDPIFWQNIRIGGPCAHVSAQVNFIEAGASWVETLTAPELELTVGGAAELTSSTLCAGDAPGDAWVRACLRRTCRTLNFAVYDQEQEDQFSIIATGPPAIITRRDSVCPSGLLVALHYPDGSIRDITTSESLRWNVTGTPSGLDVSASLSIAGDKVCFSALGVAGGSPVSFSATIELQWGGIRGTLPMQFTFWDDGA